MTTTVLVDEILPQSLRRISKRLQRFFDNNIEGLGADEQRELVNLCHQLEDIADELYLSY